MVRMSRLPDRAAFAIAEIGQVCGSPHLNELALQAVRDGKLTAYDAAGTTIVLRDDLQKFLASLPKAAPPPLPDPDAAAREVEAKLERGRKIALQAKTPRTSPEYERGRQTALRLLGKKR